MEEKLLALEKQFDRLLSAKDLDDAVSFDTVISVASKWCDAVWNNAEKPGALTFTEEEIQNALKLGKHPVLFAACTGAVLLC